jgi:hypothetical protein
LLAGRFAFQSEDEHFPFDRDSLGAFADICFIHALGKKGGRLLPECGPERANSPAGGGGRVPGSVKHCTALKSRGVQMNLLES